MTKAGGTKKYDAVIVGTGQAGPSLAARLDAEGMTVAVAERARVGGTCVNYGCTPTKALVASARVAHSARRADEFGIVVGDVRADMKRVKARMREIAGESNRGLTAMLEGLDHVTLYREHARFEDERVLRLGDERVRAEKVFLDVGTRSRVPDMPGLDRVDYLTNSSLLELEELPEHLVVVGAGPVGLEFAQMYRRFGSRVTLVEQKPRLLPREDADVAEAVAEILRGEGVELRLEAECIGVEPHESGVAITVDCEEGAPRVVGTHLLLAIGRVPNTDDLGLEAAGVEVDDRGYIEVDDQLRTSADGVWALGDCNGEGAFTHTAYNDYEIVAANLFDGEERRVSDRIFCYGLFIDPPLGRIGMSEAEARKSGRRVLVGRRPMKKVSRAKEAGDTRGFMKVLVDGDSEEILGAAILGLRGDEAVHCLLTAMYAEAPYGTIARAVHIHPTVAELLPTVLQDLEPLK